MPGTTATSGARRVVVADDSRLMRRMLSDALGVLRALRAGKAHAVPVVVVSAFSPAHGAYAVDALAEGAFDLVAKPALGESVDGFASELGRKVGEAAHAGRVRRPASRRAPRRSGAATPAPAPRARRPLGTGTLVVIASSTGGPRAL